MMITPENITVPANIRKQFDTSKINTSINNLEEIVKDNQVLGDSPYIPTPDERSLNIVQRIRETSTYYKEEGESVSSGFTNIWEFDINSTPYINLNSGKAYIVSREIVDPSVFLGAKLISAEGNVFEITEIPETEGSVYTIGDMDIRTICIFTEESSVGDTSVPAGTYIAGDPTSSGIVKIIAKSDIFPIQ